METVRPLLRILSRAVLKPLLALVLERSAVIDPWNRVWHTLPLKAFGSGCLHDWPWYFEGRSTVSVKNIHALCCWLRDCGAASDLQLFNQKELWQHPIRFEQTREGDCEDHALWAWRKVTELGYPAEFVVGRKVEAGIMSDTFHACVVLEKGGRRFLLEATAKPQARMIFPLPQFQHLFCPAVSVDAKFRTFRYDGLSLCRKRNRA